MCWIWSHDHENVEKNVEVASFSEHCLIVLLSSLPSPSPQLLPPPPLFPFLLSSFSLLTQPQLGALLSAAASTPLGICKHHLVFSSFRDLLPFIICFIGFRGAMSTESAWPGVHACVLHWHSIVGMAVNLCWSSVECLSSCIAVGSSHVVMQSVPKFSLMHNYMINVLHVGWLGV